MKRPIKSSYSEKVCESLTHFVFVLQFFVQPMQMASSERVTLEKKLQNARSATL
jgi:hypothetical protein